MASNRRTKRKKSGKGAYIALGVAAVIVVLAAALLYFSLGHKQPSVSSTTTVTSTKTTIGVNATGSRSAASSTIQPPLGCTAQGTTLATVGNLVTCGSFQAQLTGISSSNVPTVVIYHDGIYAGQKVVGESGNGARTGMGQGNVTELNISGAPVYVLVTGASSQYQTADIEVTTNPMVFETTIFTTSISTTVSTTSTSTIYYYTTTAVSTSIWTTSIIPTTTSSVSISTTTTGTTSTIASSGVTGNDTILIPNPAGSKVRYTYVPVESDNSTTVAFICKYFPVGFQNPQYEDGTYGENFSSFYTLEGQLQIADLGESLNVSNAAYANYSFGVICT